MGEFLSFQAHASSNLTYRCQKQRSGEKQSLQRYFFNLARTAVTPKRMLRRVRAERTHRVIVTE